MVNLRSRRKGETELQRMERYRQRFASCVLAAQLLWVWPAFSAAAETVRVEAPRFYYDERLERYEFLDAQVTRGTLILFSERLYLYSGKRLESPGPVRFSIAGSRGGAQRMELDLRSLEGRLEEVSMHYPPLDGYLYAEEMQLRADDTFRLKSCLLTTCPPWKSGNWTLRAFSAEIDPKEDAVIWGALLQVAGVPVAVSPWLAFPMTQQRHSGFLAPSYAQVNSSEERLRSGGHFTAPYYLVLGEEQDLLLQPEWIERRGQALGLKYRYAFQREQSGHLQAWGIDERENHPARLVLSTEDRTQAKRSRYYVRYAHNQALAEGRWLLSYAHLSDGQVHREYGNANALRSWRSVHTAWTGQQRWGDFGGSFEERAEFRSDTILSARVEDTDRDAQYRFHPQLFYALGKDWRYASWGGAHVELTTQLTRFTQPGGWAGTLSELRPSLSLPFRLGRVLEVRPRWQVRRVAYARQLQAPRDVEQDSGFTQHEGELELRMTFGRSWPLKDEEHPSALHHRLIPSLKLRALQDIPQPQHDQLIERRPALRMITFGWSNQWFLWKRADAQAGQTSRQAASLSFTQPYDLLWGDAAFVPRGPQVGGRRETPRGEPLLPLQVQAAWYGEQHTVSVDAHYHHQEARVIRRTTTLQRTQSKDWSASVKHVRNAFLYYSAENQEFKKEDTLDLSASWKVLGALSLGLQAKWDRLEERPKNENRPEKSSFFALYAEDCYHLRLDYSETVDNQGEYQSRLVLAFSIVWSGEALATARHFEVVE